MFLKNAFSFPLQIRMQKEDSSSFHSLYPKIKEWLLQNLAVSIPACQKLRNGFYPNNLFPPPPAKIPGMVFTQTNFSTLRVECRPSMMVGVGWPAGRCPLRRTPRAVNDRCHRKATPSEGSTYRSEPVERSRMCPREGERSPRAY